LGVGCFGLGSIRKVGFESYGYFIDSYDSGKSCTPSSKSIKSPQSCSHTLSQYDFCLIHNPPPLHAIGQVSEISWIQIIQENEIIHPANPSNPQNPAQ
jgi:hypothetical protein